jgi:lambda repressor-like predicted transcriptional regulator
MPVHLGMEEVSKEKGISMGKLQRDANEAHNTVKRIFKDPYYITTTETFGELARALGVSPGTLLEEVSVESCEGSTKR